MLSTDLLERQLLDALPATIRMLDLDGRLTSLHSDARPDDAETRVTHPSDHVGKPVWEVADAAVSREQVEHAMRHLRAGRSPVVRWEVATTTTDGDRVILTQMTPLHDESHAVTGFVIAATDISSSTLARDSALDAALTLARTVDLDRVYQDAALELRRMLRPDLVVIAVSDDDTSAPRVVYDTSAEGDRPALEQRFAATWRAAIERTQVVTSRTEVATEITAPMNGLAGALGAITIVSDDMTSPERVAESERYLALVAAHTAAAVERARDVDRASRHQRIVAIGEVAAGVAHELRNPIFGISSAAQLLRFRSREDPVMEKNVGRILREVERLNRMVATLLELGRPIALKPSRGDPDAVWDDVLETERGRLESRVIAVRRTRPDAAASIPIDGEQLAQAFRGILANAVDAAPEASDISLQSVVLPNGGWRCRLTNGGNPIAPDMLPRVFEPFMSTKPGSTGVGLALVRRIVGEHYGTVGIDSTSESGTTVTITLPPATRIA